MGFFIPLDQIASEVAQALGYNLKQTHLDVLVGVLLDNRIVPSHLPAAQGVNCTLTKLLCSA